MEDLCNKNLVYFGAVLRRSRPDMLRSMQFDAAVLHSVLAKVMEGEVVKTLTITMKNGSVDVLEGRNPTSVVRSVVGQCVARFCRQQLCPPTQQLRTGRAQAARSSTL